MSKNKCSLLFVCLCIAMGVTNLVHADVIKELFITITQSDEKNFEVQERIISQAGNYSLDYRALAWVENCNIDQTKTLNESYWIRCPEPVNNLALQLIYKASDAKSGIIQLITDKKNGKAVNKENFISFMGNHVKVEADLLQNKSEPKILSMFSKGVFHVLTGMDHLLFLLCLFLLLKQLSKNRWQIISVFTAFTISHGFIIFLLSYFQQASVYGFIEILVALSIVLVAREVLLNESRSVTDYSLLSHYPASAGFAMGIVHGGAFANVLVNVNTDWQEFILPLIAFNLGVEVAQLLVIALIYFTLKTTTSRFVGLFKKPILHCSGGIAVYWIVQRLVIL